MFSCARTFNNLNTVINCEAQSLSRTDSRKFGFLGRWNKDKLLFNSHQRKSPSLGRTKQESHDLLNYPINLFRRLVELHCPGAINDEDGATSDYSWCLWTEAKIPRLRLASPISCGREYEFNITCKRLHRCFLTWQVSALNPNIESVAAESVIDEFQVEISTKPRQRLHRRKNWEKTTTGHQEHLPASLKALSMNHFSCLEWIDWRYSKLTSASSDRALSIPPKRMWRTWNTLGIRSFKDKLLMDGFCAIIKYNSAQEQN